MGTALDGNNYKPAVVSSNQIPAFYFEKFPNVDKRLGPEMKSTGEAIYFIKDLKDPYFRELERNRSMYLYN